MMEEPKKEIKKIIENRKEKVISWMKDKYNLFFLGVLVLSIIIKIYYFILTKNQPLWYDEAEYMSGGVHWAFGVPFEFSPQRPILFHFLIALLLKVGLREITIKFILSTLPSILIIAFSYLLVKEMYDKRTALVTSFLFGVFWMTIFYAMRMMTDMLSLFFGILSFYLFWKAYVKDDKQYYLWIMGFVISLAFMVRLIGVLFGLTIFLFLIFADRLKILKNKHLWISLFFVIVSLIPFLLWYNSYHGNAFEFIGSNVGEGQAGAASLPIAWHLLKFIPAYLQTTFLIIFFIGLLTTANLIMGLDLFFKYKKKSLYADFFNLLCLIFVLAFFVFYFKIAEDRWMIAMSVPLFIFVSKGIIFIYDKTESILNKYLAIIFVVLILFFGAYSQLKFADELVKNKKETYLQIKEAALWIKENSEKDDIIFSNSITQNTYYSERKTLPFGTNESEFLERVKETNPKYLVVSAFESYPGWASSPSGPSKKFREIATPVNVIFMDAQQQQPAVIIYGYKK